MKKRKHILTLLLILIALGHYFVYSEFYAPVNMWIYDEIANGGNNNGVIDQSEFQTALDNEADLTIVPATTINLSSLVALDQIAVQQVNFNGTILEKNFTTDYALWINKAGMSGTLTTLINFELDGNSNHGSLMYLNSRTNITDAELHHAVENTFSGGPRGIFIAMGDNIGAQGEWRWDNVNIHDIRNDARAGVSQPGTGWATALEVVWSAVVSGVGAQLVWLNSEVYNIWGDEGDGIRLNSPNIDISGTNNSLWFENMTIRETERSAVKCYIGNTSWINVIFQAVWRLNPNIDTRSAPASLFRIGARSSAVGSWNNLICGSTFKAAPTDAFDAWDTQISLNSDGANGVGVEFRNVILESGDDIKTAWGYDFAGFALAGNTTQFKICNSTIGVASTTARGLKIRKRPGFSLQGGAKLEVDTGNTYTGGNTEAKFVEDFTPGTELVLSDLSGDCAACPTKITGGGTAVINTKVYPDTDKMEVSDTREIFAEIIPSNADDLTGTWTTSNPAVATVSPTGVTSDLTGDVTAVATGTATITFTTNDGGFTDTYVVTVEATNSEDAIMILEPRGYWTPTSGDSNSWDDTSGFELHGLEVGTITWSGNQATFDGSSYYDLPVSPFLDYTPGVDSRTFIYREGDTAPSTRGYAIAKRNLSGNLEYGIGAWTTESGRYDYYLGGLSESASGVTLNNNRLFIVIVEPTQYNVWIDGEHVIQNSTAIGTQTYTGSANIGGRTDGEYMINNGGQLDLVAAVPYAISTAEREQIETDFKVNGPPVTNDAIKPSSAADSPHYFINGVKKDFSKN